jgi:antirestriction protein ArdC
MDLHGYTSPYWMTYGQAQKLGGQVRKGEKSTPAILWKQTKKRLKMPADVAAAKANGDTIRKDEHGQYVLLILARTFALFNVAQVDGLQGVPEVEQLGEATWHPVAAAEAIGAGYQDGPTVGEGGSVASYNPARDHVQMPDRGRFFEPTAWHATLFHELVHSTGHPERLNRPDLVDPKATFGTKTYAREELTAEMGAAMLCAVAGIATEPQTAQHAAYLDHWAERIGEDPKLVVIAAQRAQKACDRILGPDQDQDTPAPVAEVAS